MFNTNLSFRSFMELEEKPTSHIDSLQDELGIRPEDFAKVPQMGANFNLGKTTFNASPYRILGYQYDAHGKKTSARIQLVNEPSNITRKQFKDRDGQQVRMPDKPDSRIYVVPIEKLNDLMTQGLSAAGAGGGMPPMM